MAIRVAVTIIMTFQATNGDCNQQNFSHDNHSDISDCHDDCHRQFYIPHGIRHDNRHSTCCGT